MHILIIILYYTDSIKALELCPLKYALTTGGSPLLFNTDFDVPFRRKVHPFTIYINEYYDAWYMIQYRCTII